LIALRVREERRRRKNEKKGEEIFLKFRHKTDMSFD
jgi:hypothetical protein